MNQLLVVALCAEWCGVCREFRLLWDAQDFGKDEAAVFVWVDIEDRSDMAGDLEIETFPSLAVFAGQEPVFYGAISPSMEVLRRISQSAGVQRFEAHERASLMTLRAGLEPPL